MGAGSSVEAAPARMSEEECKQLAGDKFDQAAWDKAEKDADGKVAKEAVISAAAPAAAEAPAAEAPAAEAPAAEAPAAEAPKRKKRLSIVGDVDVAGAGRRNSVLAEATDKAIDAADAADKPKILWTPFQRTRKHRKVQSLHPGLCRAVLNSAEATQKREKNCLMPITVIRLSNTSKCTQTMCLFNIKAFMQWAVSVKELVRRRSSARTA